MMLWSVGGKGKFMVLITCYDDEEDSYVIEEAYDLFGGRILIGCMRV